MKPTQFEFLPVISALFWGYILLYKSFSIYEINQRVLGNLFVDTSFGLFHNIQAIYAYDWPKK